MKKNLPLALLALVLLLCAPIGWTLRAHLSCVTISCASAAGVSAAPVILPEKRAEIRRLYTVEGWRKHTIARHLGIHHGTVTRALARDCLARSSLDLG